MTAISMVRSVPARERQSLHSGARKHRGNTYLAPEQHLLLVAQSDPWAGPCQYEAQQAARSRKGSRRLSPNPAEEVRRSGSLASQGGRRQRRRRRAAVVSTYTAKVTNPARRRRSGSRLKQRRLHRRQAEAGTSQSLAEYDIYSQASNGVTKVSWPRGRSPPDQCRAMMTRLVKCLEDLVDAKVAHELLDTVIVQIPAAEIAASLATKNRCR